MLANMLAVAFVLQPLVAAADDAVLVVGLTGKYLDSVDLTIEHGSPFAIFGRSGSGKTTLMMAIAGLLALDAGTIGIGPSALAELAPRARAQRIGIVFQSHELFMNMPVLENVMLAPRLSGAIDSRSRAERLLVDLGLDGLAQRRPHELSGGQRPRAAIARPLALDPQVVLFDEPSASLDPQTTRELAALLAEVGTRRQVVVVSHDVAFVEQCCERAIRMSAGRVEAQGQLAQVVER